jgi:ADP-heptose:LPS heptosyltransferase
MWAVRRLRPDACLLSFDQGSAAHLVARASAAPVRVGSTAVRLRVRDALTADVPPPPDARPATWHWEMARALLLALGSRALLPPLPPPPDFSGLGRGEPRAPGSRPRILIHAGASKALNQWGPARFAAVAERLAVDCEVAWVEHAGTTGTAPARAERVRPRTAGEMATALRQCDLFLGNNSGPMHLANALGCRGVAVTGPSAPGWDPYWHRERWTVLRHPNLACAPCERLHQSVEGCAHREHPLACLDYWSPETVEAACRARLALATP